MLSSSQSNFHWKLPKPRLSYKVDSSTNSYLHKTPFFLTSIQTVFLHPCKCQLQLQISVQRKSCQIARASGFLFLTSLMGKCCFLGKLKLQKDCNQFCWWKRVLGLVEITCWLVHASYSLPEKQAVKLTFFAPCEHLFCVPRVTADESFHSINFTLRINCYWGMLFWIKLFSNFKKKNLREGFNNSNLNFPLGNSQQLTCALWTCCCYQQTDSRLLQNPMIKLAEINFCHYVIIITTGGPDCLGEKGREITDLWSVFSKVFLWRK